MFAKLYKPMWSAKTCTESLMKDSPVLFSWFTSLVVPSQALPLTFYSWITWFLSTKSKSNWWLKRLDLRICRPPLFPLSRPCWWPLHLQMVGNMWCLSPSCSRCRVFRPTIPLSLTSPYTPAQHQAPLQVLMALLCIIMTKITCKASSLCILHVSIVHVVIFYVGQQSDAFFCPIY